MNHRPAITQRLAKMTEKIIVKIKTEKGSSLKFRKALAKQYLGDAFATGIISFSKDEVSEMIEDWTVDGLAVVEQIESWETHNRFWFIYPDRKGPLCSL